MKALLTHCLLIAALPTIACSQPANLIEAAGKQFTMGVGIDDRIHEMPDDWPLLKKHFQIITPENCMKPVAIQPTQGSFNFAQADAFVAFAQQNNLEIVGHCLVWAKDDRTPPWFYLDDAGNPLGREELLKRMKTYIDTVVGRYKGKIAMWDVVNEALADGTEDLRPSGWTKATGEEFIAKAFEYAHAADPDALLIYNDYNNELPAKREKMDRLIRSLLEKKVPIHAIGLQGHYEIDRIPFEELEKTFEWAKSLGLQVVISELDIDMIPRGIWWADGGKNREEIAKINPYTEGLPQDLLNRQAEQYAKLFTLFKKHSDNILRISFWNLHDGQSWLNDFPWKRTNHPLLFDRERKEKPAYHAVIKALTSPEN
jgi:endo-1,4-beta-xylanase